ncbi:Transcription initiation factor IIE subunit beta [Manis javanica]|nr:Transcription initiation factor IIE subunit beta [Manis javanica]
MGAYSHPGGRNIHTNSRHLLEFQKLWRSVVVDSMDEEIIEEYLKRQGISSMQESGPKKVPPIQRRKKPTSQKKRRFKTHNEHVAGVLKDYSDIAPGK